MDLYDRITIDLLNHYAFVLHEDVIDLTDEEIKVAKDFASSLNYEYKNYIDDFIRFTNKQRFKGITQCDYDVLEKDICSRIDSINSSMNMYDWKFKIFYDVNYEDYLFLGNAKDFETINLKYDIKTDEISKCDKKYNEDMIELGTIYHDYLDMDNIKI